MEVPEYNKVLWHCSARRNSHTIPSCNLQPPVFWQGPTRRVQDQKRSKGPMSRYLTKTANRSKENQKEHARTGASSQYITLLPSHSPAREGRAGECPNGPNYESHHVQHRKDLILQHPTVHIGWDLATQSQFWPRAPYTKTALLFVEPFCPRFFKVCPQCNRRILQLMSNLIVSMLPWFYHNHCTPDSISPI